MSDNNGEYNTLRSKHPLALAFKTLSELILVFMPIFKSVLIVHILIV